ncbi:MAG: tRNA 2-selenouridine(34) synthase MnmH [Burkholderiales bacterium]|nr:tRNA 2-selenouridine(34) synthase MnmH [Burkholderiales bacterium]
MPHTPRPTDVTAIGQLSEFDEIIDVRSESEFAQDHVPGAINCPVLNDDERAEVGTLYRQVSRFEARKLGAAMAAANISRHLRERFLDRPRGWRPLVYCWRGGGRSTAFAHVFAQIGWRIGRLEGGYRTYRRAVMADLEPLPRRLRWRVVCGMTGAGKSRLLRAIATAGGQVLDLEALAAHRGSVLGNLPRAPQPSQKMFDSLVWDALRRFSPVRLVYVEAESSKIGNLRVPEALIAAMRAGDAMLLEASPAVRVTLLKQEYTHYIAQPQTLVERLDGLTKLHGRATTGKWKQLALAGRWDELIGELLALHYDPAYTRSTFRHYPGLSQAEKLNVPDASDAAFETLAHRCLAGDDP